MQSLSAAGALLPESIGPYIALMGLGFAVAILGHLSRSRWMVAVGVLMIFLATLLFPIALQIFSDEPPPPGPRVPTAGQVPVLGAVAAITAAASVRGSGTP